MPNVASVLKEEISRLARKEVKVQVDALRKASAGYRKEIASLKRQVASLEREVAKSKKSAPDATSAASEQTEAPALRFSAKGFQTHRKRLGLSQADYAALIGVAVASVARWERGPSKPRKSQLAAIAAVRSLGKREALKRLEEIKA